MDGSFFQQLSNQQLVAEIESLAHAERASTARLIECLEEFDRRNLFLAEGFSSLYGYCTQRLGLCEYSSYARIEVARASRRFPALLGALRDGRLTLTNALLLAPHLTEHNLAAVLAEAAHKRKEDIKVIVARLNPRPTAATVIRRAGVRPPANAPSGLPTLAEPAPIPAAGTVETTTPNVTSPGTPPVTSPVLFTASPLQRAAVTPSAPDVYKVQLTISLAARNNLREVQDLMRHSIPNGDAGLIFERAIALLLEDIRKKKLGMAARPRRQVSAVKAGSRRIPAHVRRAVNARDQGQCAFIGAQGRCPERGFLEFHHLVPFAMGGAATKENIALRCRAHNGYEWREAVGV